MKASELKKVERSIEDLYCDIEAANKKGEYKWFIPHFCYVSDETKLQLLEDGFKVYIGNWDGIIIDALIIEW